MRKTCVFLLIAHITLLGIIFYLLYRTNQGIDRINLSLSEWELIE